MASIPVNNSFAACALCCLPLGPEHSTFRFSSPSPSISLPACASFFQAYLALQLLLPSTSNMVAEVFRNAGLVAAGDTPVQRRPGAAPLKCPRCDSSNTKFCYYNNYSLTQPRHFCKACKRYWTLGGTLRNVPVGGGCRKNKRQRKPPSAALPKVPVHRPANSPRIPAAELTSQIYGMSSTNSTNLSFQGFHLDSQISAGGETYLSGAGAHLADLQLSTTGGGYCRGPLLFCDNPSMDISGGLDSTRVHPIEVLYSSGGSGSGFHGDESSHVNWDQTAVSYGWPEYSSSVSPLFLKSV